MAKYVIDLLAPSFVLVAGPTGNPPAIGGVLAAVYLGGYISGANYNPAVSLALWIQKKLAQQRFLSVCSRAIGCRFSSSCRCWILRRYRHGRNPRRWRQFLDGSFCCKAVLYLCASLQQFLTLPLVRKQKTTLLLA